MRNTKRFLIIFILFLGIIISSLVIFKEKQEPKYTINTPKYSDMLPKNDIPPINTNMLSEIDLTRYEHISEILVKIDNYIKDDGHTIQDIGDIPICNAARLHLGKQYLDLEPIIGEIPIDPLIGNSEDSGYTICVNNHGQINISAPHADYSKLQVLN